MKFLIKILSLVIFFISCENINEPQELSGCLDINACNYNHEAIVSDNNCIYLEDKIDQGFCSCENHLYDECGVCDGNGYIDNCGVCDENTSNDCSQDECGIWGGTGPNQLCWNQSIECSLDDCPTYNTIFITDIWKQNEDLDSDSNGYYHFDYDPPGESDSDYGTVKYLNELAYTRTHWESPDSFWVYYQNQWIGAPIIDNSTYSGDDGNGQQLFYIYPPFIGDTLSIYGYICEDGFFGDCGQNYLMKDSVFIIIE
tara:strand:+ start:817 stop:1584 length:768 start_codon:yes stop_codon:yes gene_type:complete